MRILLYIEPLIEREKPLWKRGWVEAFGPKFHGALLAGGVEAGDIAFVVPEPFADVAASLFPGSLVATLSHAVFVPGMGNDALVLARSWYEGGRTLAQDEYLAEKLRDALGGFTPDLAISYTPAPFLNQAWPGLPVAHFEVGMFSRRPYPMTIYLDPFGMFRQGAPARYAKELSRRSPETGESALVESIRTQYARAMFGDANPFHGSLKPLLDGYARAALLVLQFSDFYAYDAHARYRSQYDWLIATLEHTPPEVALIVTEHPDHPLFDEATFGFLRRRYPNLVWMPQFREVHAATQFLIEYADTVITVSSSIGWQCLLWKKRLIVCGSSHLDAVADSHELADIGRTPDPDWPREKDNLLAWLLSHYYITMEQFDKPGWLVDYLHRLMTAGTPASDAAWFTQTADPADLERFYGYHAGKIVTVAASPTASDSQATVPSSSPDSASEPRGRVGEGAHTDMDIPVPIPWPPLSNAQVDESYLEAGRLLASGDKSGAIAILEHLWARQCQRWDVYCDLGALLLDAGRSAAAIAALRIAVGLEPDSTLALRNLAAAYLATGDFAQLLVVCRMLLKQDPDNPEYIAFLRDIVLSTDMRFDDFGWIAPRLAEPDGAALTPTATIKSHVAAAKVDAAAPKPIEVAASHDDFISALGYLQANGLSGFKWFSSLDEYLVWDRQVAKVQETIERHIDAQAEFPGHCGLCGRSARFKVSSGLELQGHTHLREGMICDHCHVHNRGRLLGLAMQDAAAALPADAPTLLMEATTPLFKLLSRRRPHLIGSEYLGSGHAPGATVDMQGRAIRHESILDLSFADASLALVAHADVLEHVPDPAGALAECRRVLAPHGRLVFTAPFGAESQTSQRRARVKENGEIEYLCEPEYHGPFLVYNNFGWDLLDLCRAAGFSEVRLGVNFDPLQGLLSTGRFGGFVMQPLVISCRP